MLIVMATYDTEENGRSVFTERTLESLHWSVDPSRHRIIVSDNGSCERTKAILGRGHDVIWNGANIGTANAVNKGLADRLPGEHACKIDNDVVILQAGWADVIEDVFSRDATIGICGLKRNDLAESPTSTGGFKSTLRMLSHDKGQTWLTVEDVENVMGTCQAFSSNLLDAIGYLYQPGVYGFDDSLMSLRARLAGYSRCFLCNYEIEHLDKGGSPHGLWKIQQANDNWERYQEVCNEYKMGIRPLYYGGDDV